MDTFLKHLDYKPKSIQQEPKIEIAKILNQIAKNKEILKEISKKILKYNDANLSYSSVTKKGLEIYTMLAKQ